MGVSKLFINNPEMIGSVYDDDRGKLFVLLISSLLKQKGPNELINQCLNLEFRCIC